MSQQNTRKRIFRWLIYLLSLPLWVLMGLYLGGKVVSQQWTLLQLLLYAGQFFAALLLGIHIHELGHAFFGRQLGYTLIAYRVGPLAWTNESGRMKFQFIRNRGYGGLCAMLPPAREQAPHEYGLFTAGGVLFNALAGGLFLQAAVLFAFLPGPWRAFLGLCGLTGLLFAALNLLPFTSGGYATDGKILWGLLFHSPAARDFVALQRVSAQVAAGIRPRDVALPDGVPALNLYRYYGALDRFDRQGMAQSVPLLEGMLESGPSFTQPALLYELCFQACLAGDGDRARRFFARAGRILRGDGDVNGLRVKAWYAHCVEGDDGKARRLAEQALTVAGQFPLRGHIPMERDLTARLLAVMDGGEAEAAAMGPQP